MKFRSHISQVYGLFALASPYVWERLSALYLNISNRPGSLQTINNLKSYDIKFADRIRNCEDVILEESAGIAILSCDPGRDKWNTVMVCIKSRFHTQVTASNLHKFYV